MKLSTEQQAAVAEWIKANGRNWKSALREAWMSGNYDGFAQAGYLQQIRNTFGPAWLVSYRHAN